MNTTQEHIRFDVLNDYVDGNLDRQASALVERHIAMCSRCAREQESLRYVLESVSRLPQSVLPDGDVWADIKATIDSRKDRVLPVPATQRLAAMSAHVHTPKRWQSPAFLAAAAVILVAATATITTAVLRQVPSQGFVQTPPTDGAPEGPAGQSPVLQVSFKFAEGEYNRAIGELIQAVAAQRGRLSPETVRTVDHSLAVIDSAITEATRALVADPNNATLVDLLSASYERKLDLLRRTSELGSRI